MNASVAISSSSILGGFTAVASGAILVADPGSNHSWGLIVAGAGGIGTIVGSIVTFFSNRGRQRVDAQAILAADQIKFRQDMFMQIGRLTKWSEMQDEKIKKLEEKHEKELTAKRDCLEKLGEAQDALADAQLIIANNSEYIQKLETKLQVRHNG